MIFNANIERGHIEFDNPQGFALQKAKLEGRRVVVELKQYRKTRSNNQNNYIFGVAIKIIADHLGYRSNETESLWFWVKVEVGHVDERGVPKGTKDLTTVEFEALASKVRTWASAEHGLYIPLPNEAEENYL